MGPDTRVRITLAWQGQLFYFVRMDGDRPEVASVERIRTAALLTREIAVAVCRTLRERGWQTSIITPDGVILYEKETAHSPVNQTTDERVPMQCNGVLIVPGNPPRRGWWIRIPRHNV